jgi:hypothetical protein
MTLLDLQGMTRADSWGGGCGGGCGGGGFGGAFGFEGGGGFGGFPFEGGGFGLNESICSFVFCCPI